MSFTKVAPAGIGTSPGTSIRIGDSLLHSTGLDIGTGSGIGVTIRQHGDATFTGIVTAASFSGDITGKATELATNATGTNLTLSGAITAASGTITGNLGVAGVLTYEDVTNIDAIGIITARAGINVSGGTITGDGSGLTGLPAGLGTALSQTQTDPLNKIYYTNKVLSISTTTTIDHPATANPAYTQYGDIKIEDGHDLIIKDGDDFKYDILGISTTKIFDIVGDITGVVTPLGDVNVGNNIKLGAASGIVTATALVPTTQGALSHRNVWMNGEFSVAQRGTQQTSVTSLSGYATGGPDRCFIVIANHGTFTIKQGTDAPAGFQNCMEMISTSGDSSVASNASVRWWQRFEGQDVQRFMKGTSSAKQFAISFYIKAKQIGTYAFELLDYDSSQRHMVKTYTVDAADTWEYKTIIFPGDTTGPFDNDNQMSLAAEFWLVAGTDYTGGGTITDWATTVTNKRAGGHTVNAFVSNDDYVRITGVQLEVGPVSTPFEHRSFSEELSRCQRYCYVIPYGANSLNTKFIDNVYGDTKSSSEIQAQVTLPVPMRDTPSYTGSSTNIELFAENGSDHFTADGFSDYLTYGGENCQSFSMRKSSAGGITAGQSGKFLWRATGGFMKFEAEL